MLDSKKNNQAPKLEEFDVPLSSLPATISESRLTETTETFEIEEGLLKSKIVQLLEKKYYEAKTISNLQDALLEEGWGIATLLQSLGLPENTNIATVSRLFVEQLYSFVRDRELQDPDTTYKFLALVNSLYFSSSDTAINFLDSSSFLKQHLVAEKTRTLVELRIPERMEADMNYGLHFSELSIETFGRDFQNLSPEEQLGTIKLLKNSWFRTRGMYQGYSRGVADEKIYQFFSNLNQQPLSYLVKEISQKYLRLFDLQIKAENGELTTEEQQEIKQYKQFKNSDKFNRQSADFDLNRSFKTNIQLFPEENFQALSSDSVAICDNTGKPVLYALAPKEVMLTPITKAEVKASYFQDIASVKELTKEGVMDDLLYYWPFETIVETLSDQKIDALVDFWSKTSRSLTENEWREFFRTRKKIIEVSDQISQEENRANFLLAIKIIGKFKELLKTIKSDLSKYKLKKPESSNKVEQLFTEAQLFLEKRNISGFTGIIKQIISEYLETEETGELRYLSLDDSEARHLNSIETVLIKPINEFYEKAEQEISSLKMEFYYKYQQDEELVDLHKKYYTLQSELFSENFCNDLRVYARTLASVKPKITLNFEHLSSIASKEHLTPFGQIDPEKLESLFQFMHDPEVESFLEEKLGVPLVGFDIRRQVYLLRLLVDSNPEQIQKIAKASLGFEDETNRKRFLTLLFSTAEKQDFLDRTLSLVEKLSPDSQDLLSILETYDSLIEYLDNLELLKPKSQVNLRPVAKRYIKKANSLLDTAVAQAMLNGRFDDELREKIINYKPELALAATTLQKDGQFGVWYQSVKGGELGDNKREIAKVFNTSLYVYPEVNRPNRKKEFEDFLQDKDRNFYIARRENHIVGFLSYKELTDGTVEADSLAVRGEEQGSDVCNEMITYLLEQKFPDRDIICQSYDKNPAVRLYKQKYEAEEITGEGMEWEEDGVRFITLKFPKEKRQSQEIKARHEATNA